MNEKEGMSVMLPELKYLYKNMVHRTRPAFWEQHAMSLNITDVCIKKILW